MVKIAFLILCHADPSHVTRLAGKLTENEECSVFIHVDAKSPIYDEIKRLTIELQRVYLIADRVKVYWGGASAIEATYQLLNESFQKSEFDRFVLLQGADYPLKTSKEIAEFFDKNKNVEFIRACNASRGRSKYLYAKARYLLFFDRPNLIKRIYNRITRFFDIKLRNGGVIVDGRRWDIYWGCAQFALSRECVKLILYYQHNAALRGYFNYTFPADETFFHTILFNSEFSSNTTLQGPEAEKDSLNLVSLINLCYFEYPTLVTIFTESDYERLLERTELFIRKVTTEHSSKLLDLIDADHSKKN